MASLTFYGGVGEIGGNKVLFEHDGERLWFDFGMSFGLASRYFSEYLQPKKCNGVIDYLVTGLLPELDDMCGLYRQDYLAHCAMKIDEKPAYDAVFLSHAHADHASYIHFLRSDIPVFSSEVTKRILYAIEETSASGSSDFTVFRESFMLREKKRGEGLTKARGEETRSPRDFRALEDHAAKVEMGSMSIESVSVNHSLPGACAYIAHTSDGAVVYTGDLRFHGYGGTLTERFVERAANMHPLALVCEGTRVDQTESTSEEFVRDEVARIARNRSLVVANFPIRDTERMSSFLDVAKATGRKLAISTKQAFLLKQLEGTDAGAPSLDDPNIAIYIRRKNWGLITKRDAYPQEIVLQDYEKWEIEFLDHPNAVTCEDISANQSDFIVRIDFFELPDLISLKPAKGSCYIRSVTEPHDEEDEIDLKRVQEWLKLFGLFPYHQVHASGHLSGAELRGLLHQVRPRMLIPVHTEKPDLFLDMAPPGTEVVLPELGKRIDLAH